MSQHPSASGRQTRLGLGLMIALALSLTASSTLAADGPLPTSGQELLQPGASSSEDVLSIQQLLSLYAHLYDDFETRTWGQLFTDDATFEIAYPTGGPRSRSIWRGRETIVSNLTPRRASFRAQGIGRRHYLVNPLIYELETRSARVSAYLLLTSIQRDGTVKLAGSGRYDGRVTKTPEGWRIQAWRFTPDGDPVDFASELNSDATSSPKSP